MNTVLWILQIILAVKLITTAVSHALQHNLDTMQEAIRSFVPAVPVLYLAAAGMLLDGTALLLPAAARLPSWFVPCASGAAALMFLVSMGLHRTARDEPKLFVSGILFSMSGMLLYGRLALVPI